MPHRISIYVSWSNFQGPPAHAGPDDIIGEDNYTDIIKVSKAPDEAYIQLLEQQCLAVHNVKDGFQLDTSWSYEDISFFLRLHFPFLFRYFKEGPDTADFAEKTPFLVVLKIHQMLQAVPYEPMSLNGEVLHWNCMLEKKGSQKLKLYFGMFKLLLEVNFTFHVYYSHSTHNPSCCFDVME